ncbi:MAG TPA: carboxypeptidase M32 [Steroidobacteraceae bacterium]|nr:carboxypeptidase M32 [Steroidobacteraceae bacterium]
MAASPYQQLEEEFRRLHAFRGALALLRWDSAVMMPRGSADVRGEQLAALETECHAILTAPKVSRLIERAQANSQSLEDWKLANLREMRRERDHALATPISLVSRLAKASARAELHWLEARRTNRYADFAPHLAEVVQLIRDRAALLGQHLGLAPYDALVDEFSPGVTSAEIDDLFKSLARRLPTLVREAIELQAAKPSLPLSGKFPAAKQRALCVDVLKTVGFPFDRGRLDESEHEFTEGMAGDIRITTRFEAGDPFQGLLGALHQTGHAMYDLGLPAQWRDQPVGRNRGMALEESQSLLLEMKVARSRPFLTYVKPLLEKHYGVSGPEWEVENLYRHLTRVHRGLLRADADELTYPAHVLMRYDLEKRLLSGELTVADLPEAWNEAAQTRLGMRPPTDVDGCLQEVHWAVGQFGYFPAYALGSLIAIQLWEKLRSARESLDGEIARGDFAGLFGWLREHVHSVGAKMTVQDLIKDATDRPLSAAPALRYLEAKYLEPR